MESLIASPRRLLCLLVAVVCLFHPTLAQIPSPDDPILLSECRDCCTDVFVTKQFTENALSNESLENACREGCNKGSQCPALSPTACKVGTDLKDTGRADVTNVPERNIDLGVIFCDNRVISSSRAPTPNPTPPTNRPTKSPIIVPPTPERIAEPSQDTTPIVIGVASAGVILGVILLILAMPKKKQKKGKDLENLGKNMFDLTSEVQSTVMTTVLPDIHQLRKQNPNRQSMASLREQSLLDFNPLAPHREFEIVFDFVAEEEDELGVVEGQVVQGVHAVDNQWWVVQNEHGEMGMVPLNYMKEVFPDNQPVMVQVEIPTNTNTGADPGDIF